MFMYTNPAQERDTAEPGQPDYIHKMPLDFCSRIFQISRSLVCMSMDINPAQEQDTAGNYTMEEH